MKHLIMGKNSIQELVVFCPEKILTVYTCQKDKQDPLFDQFRKNQIQIKEVSKAKLTEMVGSDSHQSLVAEVRPRNRVNIKEFLKASENKSYSLVVMLDSIFDPHNLGAILRACECFGVDLVVYSKNRGTDITPVATKVSSGASELVDIAKVSNLAETVKQFQKAGYWAYTAEAGSGARSVYDIEFSKKTLLILGSEGVGVQPIISKTADEKVYIPMVGKIDSLNVSQATAVLLAYARK